MRTTHLWRVRSWILVAALIPAISVAAGAATIFVDDSASGTSTGASWANAYTNLQDGLVAASLGDEIWVAEGLYLPDQGGGTTPGDRTASFSLKSGVKLYGGFVGFESSVAARAGLAEATVLSGDLNGDDATVGMADNSLHVVYSNGTNSSTLLDGFRITAGNANSGNNDAGGLLNENGDPVIRRCLFDGNRSNDDGAAITAVSTSDISIVECVFLDNESGDVGGAAWISSSTVRMINCSFIGNRSGRLGGAVYLFVPSLPGVELVGCVFSGNDTVQKGGAIYISSGTSAPSLIGCSFAGNTAGIEAGGVFGTTSTKVASSIFWGNSDPTGTTQGAQIGTSLASINYSCVQGWTGSMAGAGNIGLDPKFTDADGADNMVGTPDDDLTLTSNSPCLDAGDNTAFPQDDFDLDGDAVTAEPLPLDLSGGLRFQDDPAPDTGLGTAPIADMGALEGPGVPGVVTYGQGCPGSGGITPTLQLNGIPAVGNSVTLNIDKGLGGSFALLLFGLQQVALPIGSGCTLYVSPILPLQLLIPLGGSGPGAGSAQLTGVVPVGTTGAVITMQAFVHEPTLPNQYSNTNGLEMTVQ